MFAGDSGREPGFPFTHLLKSKRSRAKLSGYTIYMVTKHTSIRTYLFLVKEYSASRSHVIFLVLRFLLIYYLENKRNVNNNAGPFQP